MHKEGKDCSVFYGMTAPGGFVYFGDIESEAWEVVLVWQRL